MKLFVLFGQRLNSFPGEFSPEALECIDEYCNEENPQWLHDKRAKHLKSGEYESLVIVEMALDRKLLDRILKPKLSAAIVGAHT